MSLKNFLSEKFFLREADKGSGKMPGSHTIKWWAVAALAALIIVSMFSAAADAMQIHKMWIMPAVGIVVGAFFWKKIAVVIGELFQTPVARFGFLLGVYTALAWAMYQFLPKIIQARWGASERAVWLLLVPVGFFAIPALWHLLGPANLLPGDAKIVRRGYRGLAMGILIFIAWSYWVETQPTRLFDPEGQSLFWVDENGAKGYFAPGVDPLSGVPLRQGTKEDAERILASGSGFPHWGDGSLLASVDKLFTDVSVDIDIKGPVWKFCWDEIEMASGEDPNRLERNHCDEAIVTRYVPTGNNLGFSEMEFDVIWKVKGDGVGPRAHWEWNKRSSPTRGTYTQDGDPGNPDHGVWWGLTYDREGKRFIGGVFKDADGNLYNFRLGSPRS